jgi:XTP/dITP diphosphohydrolase
MQLILASGNEHKQREMQQILHPHELILPADVGVTFYYQETGSTYFENSYGKVSHLFTQVLRPVIGDDSGLSVPALGGAPGIYSSRYGSLKAGEKLPTPERNQYLLRKMEDIEERTAFFVCCMVLMLEDYRYFVAQETLHGSIGEAPVGEGGFGYDPVFYLAEYGKTVAQLPEEEKNRISHRGKAGKRIKLLLDQLEQEGSANHE